MRYATILAIFLPLAACAQSTQRGGRNGAGGTGPASGFGGPVAPEQIIASDVPVLEGLPQAVKVGYTIYVSGMVPLDSTGHLVGAGDLAAETRQALVNLGEVMRAARGVPGDVVRVTIYIRDLTPDKVTTVRTQLLGAVDHSQPPALTIVGVSAFAEPGIDVMLDAIGQLRSEFPDRNRMGGRP
ncbi:MAG TPA: RidA family protein [Gemmatimonadales bacterium]|jgi:enamine deaminase RidA (YjgF/YER057c/UK114 family)